MVLPFAWLFPCIPWLSDDTREVINPPTSLPFSEPAPTLSVELPESISLARFISRPSHLIEFKSHSPYAASQTAGDWRAPVIGATEFELDLDNPYRQIRNLYFWQAQCLLWVKESALKGRKTLNPYESAHTLLKLRECRFFSAASRLSQRAMQASLPLSAIELESINAMKELALIAKKCTEQAAHILREPIARDMFFLGYTRVIPICETYGLLTAAQAADIINRAHAHMRRSFPYYAPKHN